MRGAGQGQAELLQRLANGELAHHDEWGHTQVAAARADNRPTTSADEVIARLGARYDRLSSAPP